MKEGRVLQQIEDDTLPEVLTKGPSPMMHPFERANREEDYRIAWGSLRIRAEFNTQKN